MEYLSIIGNVDYDDAKDFDANIQGVVDCLESGIQCQTEEGTLSNYEINVDAESVVFHIYWLTADEVDTIKAKFAHSKLKGSMTVLLSTKVADIPFGKGA